MADILPFTPTRRAVARQRQPEIVATLLLLLEEEPLFAPTVWSDRDHQGRAFVAVRHAGVTLRLEPEDAHFAARCLIAEQAFVGCVDAAIRLRAAADAAGAEIVQLITGNPVVGKVRRTRALSAGLAARLAAWLGRSPRQPRLAH